MINKELFIKVITMLQEQEKTDDEIGHALEKVCGSYVVLGSNNLYHHAALLLLKEVCNDYYDYIDWWLYDTDDHRIWYKDENNNEIVENIESIEDLYDYILKNQNNWIIAKNQNEK